MGLVRDRAAGPPCNKANVVALLGRGEEVHRTVKECLCGSFID